MAHAEAGAGFGGQLAHLLRGHLFVGFVVEMQGLAAARVVAHNAVEDHHRAVFALLGRGDQSFRRRWARG